MLTFYLKLARASHGLATSNNNNSSDPNNHTREFILWGSKCINMPVTCSYMNILTCTLHAHIFSVSYIYHIQIVSPLNLHWNHDFNANFACIYGCVWNKHHSYQNKTSTQNQQCEQMVYRRHEHKLCINNISQVTNVDTFKKERKST